MKITIKSGGKVPDKSSGRPATYPFRDLKVGEHFTVPVEKWKSVRTAAWKFGKLLGRVFTIRLHGRTVSVWRTK